MLPREIVDSVIDNLYNDPSSLHVCGLVCRSWLTSSHHHIFSSISLYPRNMESFLKLLDSQSLSNLRSIVQKVTLALWLFIPMESYNLSLRMKEFDDTLRLTYTVVIALSHLENVQLLKVALFHLADKPASHHGAVLEMVKVLKIWRNSILLQWTSDKVIMFLRSSNHCLQIAPLHWMKLNGMKMFWWLLHRWLTNLPPIYLWEIFIQPWTHLNAFLITPLPFQSFVGIWSND